MNSLWKKQYSLIAIIFCVGILCITCLYINVYLVDPIFILSAIVIVFFFFLGVGFLQRRLLTIPEQRFEKIIFSISLIVRLCNVFILYLIFQSVTGGPFSPDPMDSIFYHDWGCVFSESFLRGEFDVANIFPRQLADIGTPFYYGIVYSIFGPSVIIARVINSVLSSISVIFIYRIAKFTINDRVARVAAIMASLFSLIIFHVGTNAKEPLMLFVLLLAVYQVVMIKFEHKVGFYRMFIFGIAIFGLFCLRTALGLICLPLLVIYLFLGEVPGQRRILYFGLSLVCVAILAFSFSSIGSLLEIQNTILSYIEEGGGRSLASIASTNILAKLLSGPLLVVLSIPAPFPSVVKTNIRFFDQAEQWYHIGGVLIWNSLSFFSIVGIYNAVRLHWENTFCIYSIPIAYFLALGVSGYATSIRFQIVSMPFMLIFAASGLVTQNKRIIIHWCIFLIGIASAIIGWNYVKLAGRGLI